MIVGGKEVEYPGKRETLWKGLWEFFDVREKMRDTLLVTISNYSWSRHWFRDVRSVGRRVSGGEEGYSSGRGSGPPGASENESKSVGHPGNLQVVGLVTVPVSVSKS